MAEQLPTTLPAANAAMPALGSERVEQHKNSRFSPLRNMNPTRLVRVLDAYHAGYLTEASQVWQSIEERDPVCQTVIPKRKRAAALLDWQILTVDDSPEAARHKQALEWFYNNCTARHGVDQDKQGGAQLLFRQMMDAVAKGYAVHEILWEPDTDNEGRDAYTATFVFVPLWFFENRTGSLRFLPFDWATDGIPLNRGQWMITSADVALMEATSVAWMFKSLPLKDWLILSEKYGFPWVQGKTPATKDSKEWKEWVEALRGLANDSIIATGMAEEVEMNTISTNGEPPQKVLVEHMERSIMALWRGGDLSSQSKGDAVGATQQEEERENIEQDDANMLTEALNIYVDREIGRMLFGSDRLLAYIKILPKDRTDTEKEQAKWDKAIDRGIEIAKDDYREQFGLPAPAEGETELLVASRQSQPNGVEGEVPAGRSDPQAEGKHRRDTPPDGGALQQAANAAAKVRIESESIAQQLQQSMQARVARARAHLTDPIRQRLVSAANAATTEERDAILRNLRAEMPDLYRQMNEADAVPEVMVQGQAAAFINGAAEAAIVKGESLSAEPEPETVQQRGILTFLKNLFSRQSA
ncbi:MAG: Mu-like protein prophage protein gp29-like protein [Puniceicoccaceae bacterium 5H]|nr:MAG: Mu-like protein prophage protein gp29-like protein [Puniceicoccaceae bacterium 5H]